MLQRSLLSLRKRNGFDTKLVQYVVPVPCDAGIDAPLSFPANLTTLHL